jgi:6-phosphogluconolactonase
MCLLAIPRSSPDGTKCRHHGELLIAFYKHGKKILPPNFILTQSNPKAHWQQQISSPKMDTSGSRSMTTNSFFLSQNRSLHCFETEEHWVAFVVSEFCKSCEQCLAENPLFHVFLCGGTTPAPIYAALAKQNLPWERIHWWMGDERFVEPNHPLRNEAMVKNQFAGAWEKMRANFSSWGDFPRPEQAAQHMNEKLEKAFPVSAGPHFCFLGIGEDGHTASLFPNSSILLADNVWAAATPEVFHGARRLSMTLPMLNRSGTVVFVARGRGKKSLVENLHAGEGNLVAARVWSKNTHICWCAEK